MRITSGRYKGRNLSAPPGDAVRPTSDKIRQALFNILLKYGHPQDSIVLDAFSGTGALALEALSRGANTAIFMDNSKFSLDHTRKNTAMIDPSQAAHILLKDATNPGYRPAMIPPVTLVFIDPPYRQGLAEKAIAALQKNDWLSDDALIIIETELGWAGDTQMPSGFIQLEFRPYGDTLITIWQQGES